MAFGIEDEKNGGKWKDSALEQKEWFEKTEDGVTRLMTKWHARTENRSLGEAPAREGDGGDITTAVVPKRKRSGEAEGD